MHIARQLLATRRLFIIEIPSSAKQFAFFTIQIF